MICVLADDGGPFDPPTFLAPQNFCKPPSSPFLSSGSLMDACGRGEHLEAGETTCAV